MRATRHIPCCLLVPTGTYRRSLRRFSSSAKTSCPGMGYHNAQVELDVVDTEAVSGDLHDHSDPRWPTVCDKCKTPFSPNDSYQVFVERLYTRSDTGEITTTRDARVGAMWFADWMTGHGSTIYMRERPNDPHLIVKTPAGDWDVDGPSSNGDGWTRSGEPPNVTVRPSIAIGSMSDSISEPHAGDPAYYHAFLTNGV